MRLLLELDDERHDIRLGRHRPGATLSDLVETATGRRPEAESVLAVDTALHVAETPLDELLLLEGTRIARSPQELPRSVRGWTVTMSGGPDAGAIAEVPRSRPLTVGRAPQADLVLPSASASWAHLTLIREGDGVRVRDCDSTNGTLVEGAAVDESGVLVTTTSVMIAGGVSLLLRPELDEPRVPGPDRPRTVTRAATVPFNRPPRPGRSEPVPPVVPPARVSIPSVSRFSAVTLAAPLVLAFAMVVIMGDARYALFAALSPIAGVGMWFEQRHRHTRSTRAEEARFTAALQTFRDELAHACRSERCRLEEDAPDPATAVRRAALPTTSLWQRRGHSTGFLSLHAGVGDVPWSPPLDERPGLRADEEVREIAGSCVITAAPVAIDLSDAGVVGIVGERAGALALARSLLCQAAVHCGPADLAVGVFCDRGREAEWSWTSWLPHTRTTGGESRLSSERERSTALLRALRDSATAGLLLVLDSEVLLAGRDALARELLGTGRGERTPATRIAGIVIAATEEQLPASCSIVVPVEPDAAASVIRPNARTRVDDVVLAGLSVATAERCARDLARLEDPELATGDASLPSLVRLPPLLGVSRPTADAVLAWWSSAQGIEAPVGTSEHGPLLLDLVKDGPHGLVGGTTGSGKSEFLRSFVAGLAARNDPTRLNFILIDFKGGAAFAACERLPHTIGTISNLDAQLADRALRSLEAEMQRRQRIFAAAGEGIDTLDAYTATLPSEPMPRLLLVVDEFAMLAKEHPEVLSSLVSIGAVGRTLGVHMILATQRPAGVVTDDILANTNLRVALRVQSRDDSVHVIGAPSASEISRTQTGRAYVKLGQNDITPVQTALVTGRAEAEPAETVEIQPVGFTGASTAPPPPTVDESSPSDLDLLLDAVVAANAEAHLAPPRPVWPEPLGERVLLGGGTAESELGTVLDDVVRVALSDDPEHQRQIAAGWDIREGNLLLIGIPGSGTSTALASLALTAARHFPPDELDLLVLDATGREGAPLEALPHTVAYVGAGPGAHETQTRFLRHVRDEVRRRRASADARRRTIVMIDGLAALRDEFSDIEGLALLDGLYRAYADGPALGLHFAVTTTRVRALPSAMEEVTTQKWLFRLADPQDYSFAGLKATHTPPPVPGRCVMTTSLLQSHVAATVTPLIDAVAEITATAPPSLAKHPAIGILPERVAVGDLGVHARFDSEPWSIPIGLDEADLAPVSLEVFEGEHALVAGPARSGKSTVLLAIAEAARAASTPEHPVAVWGACGRRSPLLDAGLDRLAVDVGGLADLLAGLLVETSTVLLLIDDAERWDDPDQAIATLITTPRPGLRVVAAGRSTELRNSYSHWTKTLARSRCGLLLQPDVDSDGSLFGIALPRRTPVPATIGRGYACLAGALHFVQSVSPTPARPR
ncbi:MULTISPECIES: FtsK/SpoIIIE domain-containing protein [unclassified Rathayibacter]|uniref:FtsK/SpoIIIE domain-containing protein n=1 Tax=unclassified Rathayibacter TaxID=2609250 RepID=UPI00188D022F|nr:MULTISPECIES: FtsK/SpoIIIE domain-containing protein [unclassified Rathayibacter]MBF4463381.1 FHA domain-containing protein [Rathayibacter sp. VKM Ac-2879]MBF4504896.1 FHA domain-containing protein [Rathayibacter sp. VKM Ac-2878]